jgi:ribosome-binding factor A
MSVRRARLAAELVRTVAEVVRDEIADPGIGFITFTRAELSKDLRQATVGFSVLGDDKERKQTSSALRRATPRIRSFVGRLMRLRNIPELRFRFDPGVERSVRLGEAFDEVDGSGTDVEE